MMLTLFILFSSLFHPFHVSVTDIRYKDEKNALQISSRIFLDDLELALRAYTGDKSLDITATESWQQVDAALERYTQENIGLWNAKNKKYEIVYVGAEIEKDVMWVYLEVEKVKKVVNLTVKNTLLHEVWGDQENIVHVRAYDQVKSARLYKEKNTRMFEVGD